MRLAHCCDVDETSAERQAIVGRVFFSSDLKWPERTYLRKMCCVLKLVVLMRYAGGAYIQ